MVAGRPLKFKSVTKLQEKIDEYFDKCDLEGTPYLIVGLALYLDISRNTLIQYQVREKFQDTVKRAKERVEASYEQSLRTNGRAGDIFGLKNFGWQDKQQIDVNDVSDLSKEQLQAKLDHLLNK